uniref:MIEF1 upstream open reading frame protein-like isoform X1 n=2 Tax=Oncorhynchus gorbuscha TaxID=8017 RepID=UPI001EAF48D7|nr:MIEF1 upstream open reading frame protein-like isoform X1 [Oncorhynchus gorbuscha]XP_046187178.1 MIEF1 upstream open reading frame protein-like isoform X1 [Oncorhynchus gorbuscha]
MPWEVQTKDPLWESCIAGVLLSPCASLMGGWSRIAVLELYRALLRAGRNLHYTDRNCYQRAVAGEFRRCQALTVPSDKEGTLKRGQFFLSSRLGGLM